MAKPPDDDSPASGVSRRTFLKTAGVGAAATSLIGAAPGASGARGARTGRRPLALKINGAARTVTVEPRVTLLRALRNHLDLTGAKEICDRGACGGCTRAARRQAHRVLPDAGRGRRRPRDHHRRGPGHAREDEPGAGRVRAKRTPSSAGSARPASWSPPPRSSARTRIRRSSRSRTAWPATSAAAGPTRACSKPCSRRRRRPRSREGRHSVTQDASPKPPEPTVTYVVKAGHASAPQTLEVHAAEGDIKPWDLDSKLRVVKGRQPRLEGRSRSPAGAKYTFDISMPGMLWGKMVRATVPAAEIVKIDTSKAEKLPGVKAVWTTEARAVRFAGQDVAAVAAISPEVAEDAARLVEVTYDERPFVTDLQKAMEEGAPTVYNADQIPDSPKAPVKGQRGRPDRAAARRPARRHRQGPGRGGRHRGGHLLRPRAHALPAGDARRDREVGGRPAHDLGLDPEHLHRARGHGRVPRHRPQERHRHHRAHGRRVRQQAGRVRGGLELLRRRLQARQAGGRARQADAGPAGGAPLHRQRARRPHDRAPGREEGRHAHRHPPPLVRHGRDRGRGGTGGPSGNLYANTPNCLVEEHDVFTNAGPAAPLRAPGHSQGAFALESAVDELADEDGAGSPRAAAEERVEPGAADPIRHRAKAIGWERRNTKAGGDVRAAQARDRDGQRELVRLRARLGRGRGGEDPPRRLGRGLPGLAGHRHRLPHRDGDGGGGGAGPRRRAT